MIVETLVLIDENNRTLTAVINNENSLWYADVYFDPICYIRTAKFWRRAELIKEFKQGNFKIDE